MKPSPSSKTTSGAKATYAPLTLKDKVLRVLGPGLITGASDDDPSGIATYSQAGAQFGYATLWTALITFPLMAAIQGMCARIGIVTSEGLTVTLKKYYPKSILYLMLLFSLPACNHAEYWRRHTRYGSCWSHDVFSNSDFCI